MHDVNELNRQYMPYVSRARSCGGPMILQAIGPALLTKNWQSNYVSLFKLVKARFGLQLAVRAAENEVAKFMLAKSDYAEVIWQRYKELNDKTATES